EGPRVVVGIEAEQSGRDVVLRAVDRRLGVLLVRRGPGRELGSIGHVPFQVFQRALDQERKRTSRWKSKRLAARHHRAGQAGEVIGCVSRTSRHVFTFENTRSAAESAPAGEPESTTPPLWSGRDRYALPSRTMNSPSSSASAPSA